MEQLSFFEKLQVLFSNILAHPLFLIILLVPVVLLLLKGKHGKKIFIGVYLLVIIFVLFIGNNVIFELFDNMMDGLFMTLYFPNFITLFVVVVLCSIIALVSFFDKKMYKINKIINITGFAFVQFMFVLILTTVRSNNINIYADNALYSNSDVLTLMQLLMGIFALQIISILIINGINKVTAILDRDPNQRNIFSRIKKVKLDDSKIGYINVKDGNNPKKTKLKPFSFDLDKIEEVSVKSSKGEVNVFESKPEVVPNIFEEKPILANIETKPEDDIKAEFKLTEKEKEGKKTEDKAEILPDIVLKHRKNKDNFKKKKDKKNKPKITGEVLTKEIDNKIKEFEGLSGLGSKSVLEKVAAPLTEKNVTKLSPIIRKIDHTEVKKPEVNKTDFALNDKYADIEKPDLMKPMEEFKSKDEYKPKEEHKPKFITEANRSLAEEMFKAKPDLKPVRPYSIEDLDIINMQLTLDTVIKYKFQRGVKLRRYDDSPTIDDLNIFDFDKLMRVLPKSKVYRKIGK